MKLGLGYEVDFKQKLDVLRRHCDDAGRDYAQIEKTVAIRPEFGDGPVPRPGALLARLHELAALGFEHVMLAPRGPWTAARIDAVASVLPEARALAG
jgi:hypothetical protein